MAANLDELTAATKKNGEGVAALTKALDAVVAKLASTPAAGAHGEKSLFGAPNVRTGEDPMSSRGFSFIKMLGVITGQCPRDQAKVELDIHDRLHNAYVKQLGPSGYSMAGGGHDGINRFLAPLSTSFMHEEMVPRDFRREMKSLVLAGTDGADHDEANWIRRKQLEAMGYGSKALSWLNEFTGGSLVAPPEMGELIELLRNKEALVNAGARVVPLPPQGRMKFPRQTAASNTYWVGENAPITESLIGTGEITLQAKKLAVLVKAPNELIRFASPAAEALMRDDMTKSLALGLDLACLEGQGGDTRPRGLLNMQFINRINSTIQGTDGDKFVANDIYRMIAAVEESNAEFETFLMRPKSLYKYYQLRSDSVSQGDGQGPYLFNLIREAGDGIEAKLGGMKVVKSTQVSQVRSKGASSNLTYVLGGNFSELMIGMFGSIEFAATTMGDTSFVNDQTWVRGILSADVAARHEAAFVLLDNLRIDL